MVALTDTSKERMWRGDAVDIVEASPERVTAPCPIAHPGGCGGCDFQHVRLSAQRDLKAAVVQEQLQRLAGIDQPVAVEALPGDGLHWRTRMQYRTDQAGHLALRRSRSHHLVTLPDDGCALATHQLPNSGWPAGAEVRVAGASVLVNDQLVTGPSELVERVHDRTYRVGADGFWQVHPQAATTLVDAVLDGLQPEPGETALDLYCGVGLFAGALASHGCRVTGVEVSRAAIKTARANVPEADFHAGPVERSLHRLRGADLVVLDPPRAGAGKKVMEHLAGLRPRAMAYVACDPAALARDVAHCREVGYQLISLRAFDLFPMTHHVECVAVMGQSG